MFIQRRKVGVGEVEQLLHIVDNEISLLVGIDLVERAHGALQIKWQAVRLLAFDAIFQLTGRTQNASAISAHATIFTNQAKLDRVPVHA